MHSRVPGDFKGPVYFYCWPPGPPDRAVYQHELLCLAEGLQELGIPCFANLNYWKAAPDAEEYVLRHDPAVSADACAIVVMSHNWFIRGGRIPDRLFHPGRRYRTVYLDLEDGQKLCSLRTEFRAFDAVLRAHFNARAPRPSNFRPWAFGLSRRLLRATETIPDFTQRRRRLLVNYRHDHPLRRLVRRRVLPRLAGLFEIDARSTPFDAASADPYHRLQWEQTGRRHDPEFYERLVQSQACACFGGFFLPLDVGPDRTPSNFARRIANRMGFHSGCLSQWDSWRFWEAMAAGCVAFHAALDRYGACLPVMPENWKHYVGIDLARVPAAVDRIRSDTGLLARISAEGRDWARTHYAPAATARRFLDVVAAAGT